MPQAAMSPPSQQAIKARLEGHLWRGGDRPKREAGLNSSTDSLSMDFANKLPAFISRSRSRSFQA